MVVGSPGRAKSKCRDRAFHQFFGIACAGAAILSLSSCSSSSALTLESPGYDGGMTQGSSAKSPIVVTGFIYLCGSTAGQATITGVKSRVRVGSIRVNGYTLVTFPNNLHGREYIDASNTTLKKIGLRYNEKTSAHFDKCNKEGTWKFVELLVEVQNLAPSKPAQQYGFDVTYHDSKNYKNVLKIPTRLGICPAASTCVPDI